MTGLTGFIIASQSSYSTVFERHRAQAVLGPAKTVASGFALTGPFPLLHGLLFLLKCEDVRMYTRNSSPNAGPSTQFQFIEMLPVNENTKAQGLSSLRSFSSFLSFPSLLLSFLSFHFPFHSFPFLSIPFHSFPFLSIPFHSFPFLSITLEYVSSIPFHSLPFPFHSFPFLFIPFRSFPFLSIPFHSLPFPSIPLHSFFSCPVLCFLSFRSFPCVLSVLAGLNPPSALLLSGPHPIHGMELEGWHDTTCELTRSGQRSEVCWA